VVQEIHRCRRGIDRRCLPAPPIRAPPPILRREPDRFSARASHGVKSEASLVQISRSSTRQADRGCVWPYSCSGERSGNRTRCDLRGVPATRGSRSTKGAHS
jgi:hypothetical protein